MDPYAPFCEMCESDSGACLGVLGDTAHFRCVRCGWQWSEEVPEWAREENDHV